MSLSPSSLLYLFYLLYVRVCMCVCFFGGSRFCEYDCFFTMVGIFVVRVIGIAALDIHFSLSLSIVALIATIITVQIPVSAIAIVDNRQTKINNKNKENKAKRIITQ